MEESTAQQQIEQYEKVVQKIMTCRDQSINGRAEARERTREVMRYIKHDPYTEVEKAEAAKFRKPLLRYGVIISKLQTLLAGEQNNRRKTQIIADYFAMEDLVKLVSDNFDYISEREDLERKLLMLLADGLLYATGGWIRMYVELDDMGYLTFKFKLYDTLGVHPDKEFKESSLSDCKSIEIDDWKTIDEIKNKYGVSDLAGQDENEWWREIEEQLDLADQADSSDDMYKIGDRYLLVQQEELREVPVDIVEIDGEIYSLTSKELKAVQKNGQQISLLRRSSSKRVFFKTVVPFFKKMVLQDKESPLFSKDYTMFYCGSFDWHARKCDIPSWGYLLLDPQDRINKGKSQEVDYMIQKLGGYWHVDEREKKAMAALLDKAGEPNAIIPYGNIKNKAQRDTGSADVGSVQMVQNGVFGDLSFMEEISNITQSMAGKGGKSGETGVLFEQKVHQSLLSANPYYEIKAQVNERIVRSFLKQIPQVYFEDDRLLPINGENGLRYEMVNLRMGNEVLKDIKNLSARAVLEDAENVPNRLERAFNENIAFAKMLIDAGYPPEKIPFMLIVKNSTIRDKKEWVAALEGSQRMMSNKIANKEANEDMLSMIEAAISINQKGE